jgi:hypothetical protein
MDADAWKWYFSIADVTEAFTGSPHTGKHQHHFIG